MVAEHTQTPNPPSSPVKKLLELDLQSVRHLHIPPLSTSQPLVVTPSQLHTLRNQARFHVPDSTADGVAILDLFGVGKAACRLFTKSLNISGASDFKIIVSRHVIACKMVQRRLCFQCIEDVANKRDRGEAINAQHIRIRDLPQTAVKFLKSGAGKDRVHWTSGDIPSYDEEGEIIPSDPPLHPDLGPLQPSTNMADAETLTDFEAEEYCRLLHVLADPSLSSHLQELRISQADHRPWVQYVAPLFNDPRFQPAPVKSLSGGVSKNDIKGLLPLFLQARDGEMLCNRFAEFKTLYRAAVRSYVSWGDDDQDTFSDYCQGMTYVMYAFCLLENYPELEPLTLQAPESETPAEEEDADEDPEEPQEDQRGTKRTVEATDLDEDAASMPVPKRVRAAMLQDNERTELKKIIEGGDPSEGGVEHGLTKSEVIQQMEREEKEKEKLENMVAGKVLNHLDDDYATSVLISRPRSAAKEEIEMYAREKAIAEARVAKQRYTTSVLQSIRETQQILDSFKGTAERRRIHVDMLNDLYTKLSQAQRDSG